MGRASRLKPQRLAEKLLSVRVALGLSQAELLRRLGYERELSPNHISKFELGKREPSLPVLLAYARAAGVVLDVLVDDELDLPARLPSGTQTGSKLRSKATGKVKATHRSIRRKVRIKER